MAKQKQDDLVRYAINLPHPIAKALEVMAKETNVSRRQIVIRATLNEFKEFYLGAKRDYDAYLNGNLRPDDNEGESYLKHKLPYIIEAYENLWREVCAEYGDAVNEVFESESE